MNTVTYKIWMTVPSMMQVHIFSEYYTQFLNNIVKSKDVNKRVTHYYRSSIARYLTSVKIQIYGFYSVPKLFKQNKFLIYKIYKSLFKIISIFVNKQKNLSK